MKMLGGLTSILLSLGYARPADFPKAEISNGEIVVKLYLPDREDGYYRGTRFDWSGVLYSLEYKGHNFYGPWFQKTRHDIHDFIYEGADIVAGPCSATSGPADEFAPLGWDDAKRGGNFIKIGVGALRKTSDAKYDNYHLYEIADPGKRTVSKHDDSIEFTQDLADSSSGYSFVYVKRIRLVAGKPQMILEHRLKNRGSRAIHSNVYNHNFLVLDGQAPAEGLVISVPFSIQSSHPPSKELAEIRKNEIVYLKTLKNQDTVATPLEGFGSTADDNQIRIENRRLGAGMKIQTDRPLFKEALWSIRSVVAMEPYVTIDVEPGAEFTWTTTYDYYTLPISRP